MKYREKISGYIYTLSYDDNVFYVGATTMSTTSRLSNHICMSKNPKTPVNWFIHKANRPPVINTVEHCVNVSKIKFKVAENRWIDFFNADKKTLTNVVRNIESESQDIRIVTDKSLHNEIKKLAKENKRTMGKQAEFMIQQLIDKKP